MSRPRRIAFTLSLLLAACAHGPRPVKAPPGWSAYLDGDSGAAREGFAKHEDLLSRLGHANLVHDAGRYIEARDLWMDLVRRAGREPDSPWTRAVAAFAAHRLSTVSSEAGRPGVDWATALEEAASLPVGPEARLILAGIAANEWLRIGDPVRARRLDEQRGCPEKARVSPPAVAGIHRRLVAPWNEDPGGETAEASSCVLPLRGADGGGGVYTVTLDLWAPRETELLLWVDTAAPFAVEGYAHDSTDRFLGSRVWLRTIAPEGASRLALRVAGSATGFVSFGIVDRDGGPAGLRFEERGEDAPTLAGFSSVHPSSPPDVRGSARAVSLLLAAHEAYRYGDADRARRSLEVLLRIAPRFAPAWALLAAVDLTDPALTRSTARDRARRALEQAWSLDAEMARAAHNLALIARDDERADEALDWIRAGLEVSPDAFQLHLLAADIYMVRGWGREASDALARADAGEGSVCAGADMALALARKAEDPAAEAHQVQRLVRCDATSDIRAALLRGKGRLVEARDEYIRLLGLRPRRVGWRLALSELRVALDDRGAAREELARLVEENPRSIEARRQLADLAWAGGDGGSARRWLSEGLALEPGSRALLRALRATGWRDPVEDFRVEGRDVLQAFEKDRWRPGRDAPAVIVLDRTVLWVAEDGSTRTLTHNIIRPLTKNGIERFGEVDVPEDADVLTVRTLKANGETREAQIIPGKESLSAPDLQVGDYVELEWVDHAPPEGGRGLFLADRFYFRSYDAPLYRSEYIVALPEGMPLQIDRRAAAPEARETRRDGLRVLEFSMGRMDQLVPEPEAGPFLDEVPSVRVASGATWESWRDRWGDQVYGGGRIGSEARSAAEELCDGRSGMACVTALSDYVAQIDLQGSAFQPAAATFAERSGSRLMLLRAFLRAVGLAPEVWLARPVAMDVADGAIPETEGFTTALLRLPVGDRVLWLDPRARWAPPGVVSPGLRGARAIHIEADGPLRWGEVGDGRGEDARTRALDVDLAKDGSATIEGREDLSGWPAIAMREALDQIAPDRVKEQFEQHWLGFHFPGVSLDRLDLEDREEIGKPLRFAYRFSAPRVGRRQGATMRVALAFFPALIGRAYVGVSARRAALQVAEVSRTAQNARVSIPRGLRIESLPEDVRLDTPFGGYRRAVRLDGDTIVVDVEFFMPRQRVPPDRYAAFVEFASKVDAYDAEEAVLGSRQALLESGDRTADSRAHSPFAAAAALTAGAERLPANPSRPKAPSSAGSPRRLSEPR